MIMLTTSEAQESQEAACVYVVSTGRSWEEYHVRGVYATYTQAIDMLEDDDDYDGRTSTIEKCYIGTNDKPQLILEKIQGELRWRA
jgi:hypothetical protein